MLEQGVPEEDVRRATYGNAAKAYGYSGQIDMAALEKEPAIDQRQLFNDNSVLRGQEARVDDGVFCGGDLPQKTGCGDAALRVPAPRRRRGRA